MSDPFDFDGVDASGGGGGSGDGGDGGGGVPRSPPPLRLPRSPMKIGRSPTPSPEEDGDEDDDTCSRSSSVASSSVAGGGNISVASSGMGGSSLGGGRRGGRGGGKRSKRSASAMLQSRLEELKRKEQEAEQEEITAQYALAGKKKGKGSGGGSSIGSAGGGSSRRRKKKGKSGTASSSKKVPVQTIRRPGSAAVRPESSFSPSAASSRRRTGKYDDDECSSRADTPKAQGGGGGVRSSSKIPTMLDSAHNDLEPSQSSFLSLSASPRKNSCQSQDSSCIQDEEGQQYQGRLSVGSHLSMESATGSYYSNGAGGSNASSRRQQQQKRTVRRGYGVQSQSSAASGGGAGSSASHAYYSGGGSAARDVDDLASVSTAGTSVGSDAILGAGVDAFAVQDAGTYRMLSDDCSYLCDTVVSATSKVREDDGDDGSGAVIRHTSVTADAACDLALLFASARNRAVLLRTARILHSHHESGGAASDRSRDALDSILDAIGCAPPPISCDDGDDGVDDVTEETRGGGGGGGRTIRSRRKRLAAAVAAKSEETGGGEVNHYDRIAAHALSVLSYYLSLECSKGEKSALRDIPAAARRVRRRVLRHGAALRGVSRMVQFDPLVETILGESVRESGAANRLLVAGTNLGKQNDCASESGTAASNRAAKTSAKATLGVKRGRENEEEEESDHVETSVEKNALRDPTKAGRQKRRGKKRRLLLGQGRNKRELETIPEDSNDTATNGARMGQDSISVAGATLGQENGVSDVPGMKHDDLPQCSPAKSVQSGEGSHNHRAKAEASLDFVASDERGLPSQSSGDARVGVCGTEPKGAGAKGARERDDNIARLSRKVHKATSKLAKRTAKEPLMHFDVAPCTVSGCSCHQLKGSEGATKSCGCLALGALSRFLTGKDGDGASHGGDDDENQSDGDGDEEESDVDATMDQNDADHEENNLKNPLIFTNVMLRRSESLPHLAQAVSDTFVSIVHLIGEGQSGTLSELATTRGTYCEASINYLRRRVSSLFSIIDGASCLSSENRRILCSGSNSDGVLIKSLLRLITAVPFELEMSSAAISDIVLSALRTLTSLTHENSIAAEQMLLSQTIEWQSKNEEDNGSNKIFASLGRFSESDSSANAPTCLTGTTIILHHLHRMVTAQQVLHKTRDDVEDNNLKTWSDDSHDKHCYDVVIFCLNTLTNIVEMAAFKGARRQIFDLKLRYEGNETRSLSWLASWLTGQTTSYRDAVMKGSFGEGGGSKSLTPEGSNEPRELEKHEEEYLVTAGNGFILLAYLMKSDDGLEGAGDEWTSEIRRIILSEMPTDDSGRQIGVTLIVKTLKAFCNFYHFSIGPLSVAIVSPVVKLIKDLEKMAMHPDADTGTY